MTQSIVEALRKADLFKSFPEGPLKTLADHCKKISIKDEEILCKEGDPGNKMWVIMSGKLIIYKSKKTIDVAEVGSFLGEMSLIDHQPRSASIRGIGDVDLLEIDDATFNKYILSEPRAMTPFIEGISSRIRNQLKIISGENQRLNCLVHDMRNYLVPLAISEGQMLKTIKLLEGSEDQQLRDSSAGLTTAMRKMVAVRDNLITLIDQTLSMGIRTKADYVKNPANLSDLVKETAEETTFHKHMRGKELIAHVPENYNKETICNVLDLKRVLQNLIVNAGYASEKGGKIEVILEDKGDGIQINIVDHGSGIPDEIQPLLLKEKYTTKPDGNGFGLLSCREIVEKYHEGKFGFTSKVGEGSTFFFKVPN